MNKKRVKLLSVGSMLILLMAAILGFTLPAAARCVPVFSDADAAQCGAFAGNIGACQKSGLCRWDECTTKDPNASQAIVLKCLATDQIKCNGDPDCRYVVGAEPKDYGDGVVLKKEDPIQGDTGTCLAKIEPDKYQFVCNRTKVCDQARICYWKPKDAGAVGGGAAGGAGVANSGNTLKDIAYSGLNRLPAIASPAQFIGLVAKMILGVMGTLTLLFYVYAGFLWMTAQGNSEKTEKSRSIFLWTTLGVMVMLGSYILVDLIFSSIG